MVSFPAHIVLVWLSATRSKKEVNTHSGLEVLSMVKKIGRRHGQHPQIPHTFAEQMNIDRQKTVAQIKMRIRTVCGSATHSPSIKYQTSAKHNSQHQSSIHRFGVMKSFASTVIARYYILSDYNRNVLSPISGGEKS